MLVVAPKPKTATSSSTRTRRKSRPVFITMHDHQGRRARVHRRQLRSAPVVARRCTFRRANRGATTAASAAIASVRYDPTIIYQHQARDEAKGLCVRQELR